MPRLFANKQIKLFSEIRCLHPEKQLSLRENETEIKMILIKKDRTRPIWSANFQMPSSESTID